MTKRVGFIGAGLMGHGVARNVLEKGYPLTVLGHRNRAPIEDLLARGATEGGSAAELARGCDVVFTCLPNSSVLEDVLLGPGGVREGAARGLVVADLTTGQPAATVRLAEILAEHDVRLIDAPMTLTPKEAEEGRLNLLVGGEAALVEELRPLFDTFCERVFHVGPIGSAHTLKLVNNFLGQSTNLLAVEAIVTALAAGVDPKMMRDVISVSGGNSTSFQRMIKTVVGEEAGGGGAFSIRNALKDVRYFTEIEAKEGIYAPLGDTVARLYELAVALGYGDEHLPRLFDVQKKLSTPR